VTVVGTFAENVHGEVCWLNRGGYIERGRCRRCLACGMPRTQRAGRAAPALHARGVGGEFAGDVFDHRKRAGDVDVLAGFIDIDPELAVVRANTNVFA
jgi:hypothetical protein